MVGQIISILDRLLKLVELREFRGRRIFIDFVEPAFNDLTHIHEDYRTSFKSMEEIAYNESIGHEEFVDLLEQFRTTYSPLRMKIQSLVSCLQGGSRSLPPEVVDFVKAVSVYFSPVATMGTPYNLVISRILETGGDSADEVWSWRHRALDILERSRKQIETQWARVTEAYAKAKVSCLS